MALETPNRFVGSNVADLNLVSVVLGPPDIRTYEIVATAAENCSPALPFPTTSDNPIDFPSLVRYTFTQIPDPDRLVLWAQLSGNEAEEPIIGPNTVGPTPPNLGQVDVEIQGDIINDDLGIKARVMFCAWELPQ